MDKGPEHCHVATMWPDRCWRYQAGADLAAAAPPSAPANEGCFDYVIQCVSDQEELSSRPTCSIAEQTIARLPRRILRGPRRGPGQCVVAMSEPCADISDPFGFLFRRRAQTVIDGVHVYGSRRSYRPFSGQVQQRHGIAAAGRGEGDGNVWIRRESRHQGVEIRPELHACQLSQPDRTRSPAARFRVTPEAFG